MNILLFITSFLLVLTAMTYARIENFSEDYKFRQLLDHYTKKTEHNTQAIKRYEALVTSKEESSEKEINAARSTLNFRIFTDSGFRAKNIDLFESYKQALTALIEVLYGSTPFFQEMELKHPNFIEEIINLLIDRTDSQEVKKTKELANIDFEDPDLNAVFTKVLKGSCQVDLQVVQDLDETIAEKVIKGSASCYLSLLDFINLSSKSLKVRVFLASRQLLSALWQSPDLADQIMDVRYQLYRRAKQGEDLKVLSDEFKSLFPNTNYPDKMLDFGISKTNPRRYS